MFILHIRKSKLRIMAGVIIFIILVSLLWEKGNTLVNQNAIIPLEQVETEEKVIALTVNVDWGEDQIPGMLEIFKEYDVKATFFVTGRWAGNNPEVLEIIYKEGHEIENHGYSHSHPDQDSIAKNKEEILKTEEVIQKVIGEKTSFFAPPYGERGKNGLQSADELGYTTVLWTLDTVDWQASSTPQIIARRILYPKARNGLKPSHTGAIVLMHPKENTVKALPTILNELQKQGFQFVTIKKLITFELAGNTTS